MSRARKLAEKRQIAHAALDDFARVAHDDLRQKKVMIYGFGQIAEAGLFFTLARSDILCPLEIYIAGYARPDKENIRRSLLRWEQKEGVIVNPHIPIHPLLTSEVSDVISSIDLCVVTADRAESRTEDRIAICRANLPIADDIVHLVRRNDTTHFDIVTNLGELLSYKIWKDTDCDPYRLFSNAHVDKLRLDAFIIEYLTSVGMSVHGTDAFVVGTHQNPWPVINDMRVNTGREYVPFGNLGVRIQREFQQRIACYASEQIHLKRAAKASGAATLHESGVAISDVIASFVNRGGLVNCGVFRDGKYVLGPTDFAEGIAKPSEDLLSRMTATDRAEFELRERMIEGWIAKLELDKPVCSVHPVTAYPVVSSPSVSLPYQSVVPSQRQSASPIPPPISLSLPLSVLSPQSAAIIPSLYERVTSHSSVQLAVFGAAAITLIVAGIAVVHNYHSRKQQQESEVVARVNYEIVQRMKQQEPWFVQHVFHEKEDAQFGMFSLHLYDVKDVRYSGDGTRGLFTARCSSFAVQERFSGDQHQGQVLGVFHRSDQPSIEIVLAGSALLDPKWKEQDVFRVTGMSVYRLPFGPGSALDDSFHRLPQDYTVRLRPDNSVQLIEEKGQPRFIGK